MKKRTNNKVLDFKHLFETSSKREFLGIIYYAYNMIKHNCSRNKINFKSRLDRLDQVFNYFHEDDLYMFFKINHELHKDKSKFDYIFSIYSLFTDLISQTPEIEFVQLDEELIATPKYIHYGTGLPFLVNLSRDFFIYNLDTLHIFNKEELCFHEYKTFLKEIHQEGLIPLDISSYSFTE